MTARKATILIHSIADENDLPDMDLLTGKVAFIFDGCIVSGWPLDTRGPDGEWLWEADSDVGRTRPFGGVTHWVEFTAAPGPSLTLPTAAEETDNGRYDYPVDEVVIERLPPARWQWFRYRTVLATDWGTNVDGAGRWQRNILARHRTLLGARRAALTALRRIRAGHQRPTIAEVHRLQGDNE
jgi:hypothetical protein